MKVCAFKPVPSARRLARDRSAGPAPTPDSFVRMGRVVAEAARRPETRTAVNQLVEQSRQSALEAGSQSLFSVALSLLRCGQDSFWTKEKAPMAQALAQFFAQDPQTEKAGAVLGQVERLPRRKRTEAYEALLRTPQADMAKELATRLSGYDEVWALLNKVDGEVAAMLPPDSRQSQKLLYPFFEKPPLEALATAAEQSEPSPGLRAWLAPALEGYLRHNPEQVQVAMLHAVIDVPDSADEGFTKLLARESGPALRLAMRQPPIAEMAAHLEGRCRWVLNDLVDPIASAYPEKRSGLLLLSECSGIIDEHPWLFEPAFQGLMQSEDAAAGALAAVVEGVANTDWLDGQDRQEVAMDLLRVFEDVEELELKEEMLVALSRSREAFYDRGGQALEEVAGFLKAAIPDPERHAKAIHNLMNPQEGPDFDFADQAIIVGDHAVSRHG